MTSRIVMTTILLLWLIFNCELHIQDINMFYFFKWPWLMYHLYDHLSTLANILRFLWAYKIRKHSHAESLHVDSPVFFSFIVFVGEIMAEIMQERLKIKTTTIQYVQEMFYHCRLRFHVCNVEDLDTLYCNNDNNCSWSK